MSISKHTINRFVEILALGMALIHVICVRELSEIARETDYPELKMYSVHPGEIMTEGADVVQTRMGLKGEVPMPDTVELAAATYMWLTGRNAEFLNGR